MNFIAKISTKDHTEIYKTAQGTKTDVQQLLQFPPSLIFFGFTWPIAKTLEVPTPDIYI